MSSILMPSSISFIYKDLLNLEQIKRPLLKQSVFIFGHFIQQNLSLLVLTNYLSWRKPLKDKFGKILIVDDNEDILTAASLLLKNHMELVHIEKNPNMIPNLLMNESYDVILLDMNFSKDMTSGSEGFLWLDKILEIDSSAVVILITAYGDVEMAVNAIKKGATDFILKPWQNEKLLATISSALQLRKSKLEIGRLRQQQKQLSAELDQKFQDIIGKQPAILKIFESIEKVAETDANVLILGENGTGKELIARALHRQSTRGDKVFINVDLGSINENLFESELFGHMKGAFTDAKSDHAGRFEIASGGTLFLDEIGNLPLNLQAKLLNVLQNRQVTRVGSNKPLPIDIRLICATNLSISNLVASDQFRQDLFYRINTVEINIPPLRERKDDIPLLSDYFLKIYSKKYNKKVKAISTSTHNKLEKYLWPGNIRELQHALERAIIMSDSEVLQPGDFLFSASGPTEDSLFFENYNLHSSEKIIIQKAITKHDGNISKAAKELGLTRASLYRRMDKHNIPVVAEIENNIVGIANCLRNEGTGWISHIIVSDKFRNQGIGYKLTKHVMNILSENNCTSQLLIATKWEKISTNNLVSLNLLSTIFILANNWIIP